MLGETIAALRKRRCWSQQELARRLHVSPSAVGMYEQGRREPSLDRMLALSELFGITADELLRAAVPAETEKEEISPMTDEAYMQTALTLAAEAADEGEVPVGCIVVTEDGRIVGRGRNRREKGKNALLHAELEAIGEACRTLGGWRLPHCTLYVTLEPCPMCAGAIINARIVRVVYGADDAKAGSCNSVIRLFDLPYNHKPEVVSGVLAEQCAEQLSSFFRSLRQRRLGMLKGAEPGTAPLQPMRSIADHPSNKPDK